MCVLCCECPVLYADILCVQENSGKRGRELSAPEEEAARKVCPSVSLPVLCVSCANEGVCVQLFKQDEKKKDKKDETPEERSRRKEREGTKDETKDERRKRKKREEEQDVEDKKRGRAERRGR